MVVVVVVVVVVDEVDVVVVSAEVGSGIESGPSPGAHAPTSITPTIATLFQRTCLILPGRISFAGAKTPLFRRFLENFSGGTRIARGVAWRCDGPACRPCPTEPHRR